MRPELLDSYERELTFLRDMGAEFGRKYPRVASRLLLEPDRCEDPHVERLIESFAFLAARLHLRLDDDLPELTSSLLNLIYPHYLRPIPAMTVVECQVESESAGKQGAAFTLPTGTALNTRRTIDGMTCRFRTTYPVELWPITVAECVWRTPEQLPRPVRVAGAAAALRMVIRGGKDVKPGTLGISSLRFYLAGDSNLVFTLYELLASKCISISLRDPRVVDGRVISISPSMLKPVGFEEDECLLPYPRRSFDGYRLLQEYFAFPQKFLFFDITGLEAMSAFSGDEIELLFHFGRFDRPERQQVLEVGVSTETLRLGCTPAINLFSQAAEPVLLTQTQHEYRVTADARYTRMMEIFSIDDVLATSPSKRQTTLLAPLYAYRYNTLAMEQGIFWHANRRYTSFEEREPSSVFLSLVDVNGLLTEPAAEVLTVHCTCSNHDLPSRLSFGAIEGDFEAVNFAGVQRIRALHRPTGSLDPPAGKGQLWRLISQLSLNYLSLGEEGLGALQEILRIHNFSQSPQVESQVAGVVAMRSKRHFAIMRADYGNTPARGVRVEIELDERQFANGGAYLFASVLERFLGSYVSMNSFCQLRAESNLRKEGLGTWMPRAGSRVLL
ncbi:type VI secretion system baseplate subunit TssF [Granulicella sp. dw_53]|uniref:type VI secretion system baseplate subunit TssF n=1 Tax=Granulicella sp. dw_53 TaxID=2719792 RepID=UPI001BD3EAFC|nr:type VI secretion system baseplate subunit TssF [Granulicella sp. dw_53]